MAKPKQNPAPPLPRSDERNQALTANARVRHRSRPSAPPPQPEEPEAKYEVGYKKPPKETRFKKGVCPNRKGRPKGTRNLKTEILAEISELIVIRENGKARRVPKLRAYIKRLSEKALNGDLRAILALCTLVRTHLHDPEDNAEPEAPLAEEDLALLMEFAGRQRPSKK